MNAIKLDNFTRSYIESALWSSTDDDGVPLDSVKYADTELADETLARMASDCERFQSAIANHPELQAVNLDRAQTAHDFWLTRNHHGAGFWDGDYPEPEATILTDLAHSFGECDIYVGDDGKFYLMGGN